MKYAVAHAPVGPSVVLGWEKDNKRPKLFILKTEEHKEAFVAGLGSNDTLFTDLGPIADRLTLAAQIRGVNRVWRIPSFRLGDEVEAEAEEASAEELAQTDEEDEIEERDSSELARRKLRAEAIRNASIDQPRLFYPSLEPELPLLTLIVLWRGFYLMQRTRIAAHLRLLSVYRDLYLVDAAQRARVPDEKEEDAFILERLTREKGFGDMPPEARKKYLMELKTGDEVFEAVTEREKELLKEVGKQLPRVPIYNQVFEPIPGCGVTISARLIGAISDIRRFPTLPKFRAYFGLHHFADGSRARRRKGKVSNWNQVGKQGFFHFTEAVGRTPARGSDWRDLLDQRRGYELANLLRAMDEGFLPLDINDRGPAESVNDVRLEDIDVLGAMVDGLRGVEEVEIKVEDKKRKIPYADHARAKYATDQALVQRALHAYGEGLAQTSPAVKKQMKGVKAKSLDKAKRYIRQRLAKHLFHRLWEQRPEADRRAVD